MTDNMRLIEQTGALKHLSENDREMLAKNSKKLGSTLCGILRHNPDSIGIDMDKQGWVNAGELIRKFNTFYHGKKIYLSLPVLMEVVRTDDKQRYGLKGVGTDLMIRCRQGHSIPWLEMDYPTLTPPDILYHGTVTAFLGSIMNEGLRPMDRQKVHLSGDILTAKKVADRRRSKGNAVILQVDAKRMAAEGKTFYLADNGVWLTDHVETQYLTVIC